MDGIVVVFNNKRSNCFKFLVTIVFMLTSLTTPCSSSGDVDFAYDGDLGPDNWGKTYPACLGKHQSPINIEFEYVKIIEFPELFFQNFDTIFKTTKIQNNGHTVMLTILEEDDEKIPRIYGGPLKGVYEFYQLHFHWGQNDSVGSENVINNQRYPLELHLVFFKTYYGSYEEAILYKDGLSVLSFLFRIAPEDNPSLEQFRHALPKVYQYNAELDLSNFMSLTNFTNNDRSPYFAYIGSLTTPPCSEIVIWVEFVDTIPISHDQVQIFRSVMSTTGNLTHNYRPVQHIYDRIIYYNSSKKNCLSDFLFLLILLPLIKSNKNCL